MWVNAWTSLFEDLWDASLLPSSNILRLDLLFRRAGNAGWAYSRLPIFIVEIWLSRRRRIPTSWDMVIELNSTGFRKSRLYLALVLTIYARNWLSVVLRRKHEHCLVLRLSLEQELCLWYESLRIIKRDAPSISTCAWAEVLVSLLTRWFRWLKLRAVRRCPLPLGRMVIAHFSQIELKLLNFNYTNSREYKPALYQIQILSFRLYLLCILLNFRS